MNQPHTLPTGKLHLAALRKVLRQLEAEAKTVGRWAGELARLHERGGRVLTIGNGGSACEAQHLAGELLGRYRDDREGLSALALLPDAGSLTAICNDYGAEQMFARQVRAHGRRGDLLIACSTSGESPNVTTAVKDAREIGMATWALSGRRPNSLAELCDESICIDCVATATLQEAHLVLIHLLCAELDCRLGVSTPFESVRAVPT